MCLMVVQGNLMTDVKSHFDLTLHPVAAPFAWRISGNCEYLDGNARPHQVNFLRQQCVRALQGPAKSPDMLPIKFI